MTERAYEKADFSTPGIGSSRLHILAKLAIITCLIPIEFTVGPLLLTPSRIYFMLVIPYLTVRLVSGAYGGLVAVDILVFLNLLWFSISIIYNHPDVAVTFIGQNVVLMLGGYATARAAIRGPEDFYNLCKFIGLTIVLMFPFAVAESITSTAYIPRMIERLPGISAFDDTHSGARLGLERAQVVFVHPIAFGLYCSLGISLIFVGLRGRISSVKRYLWSFIAFLCVFLSVSSGPFLAFFFQAALISWSWLLRNIDRLWLKTAYLGAAAFLVLEVLSDRPALVAIASRLAFNPATANARVVLFDYGMAQIFRTPILGVGYHKWDLPGWLSGSVDNHWLLVALTYGVPTFVFFLSAYVVAIYKAGKRDFPVDSIHFDLRRAWSFMMIGVAFTLVTVAVWGNMLSIMYFMIGSGIWMQYCKAPQETSAETDNSKKTDTRTHAKHRTGANDRDRQRLPTSRPRREPTPSSALSKGKR